MAAYASIKTTATCVSVITTLQANTARTVLCAKSKTLVKMAEFVITTNGFLVHRVNVLTVSTVTSANLSSANVSVGLMRADVTSALSPPNGTIVCVPNMS